MTCERQETTDVLVVAAVADQAAAIMTLIRPRRGAQCDEGKEPPMVEDDGLAARMARDGNGFNPP